jgi:hypothetical protein
MTELPHLNLPLKRYSLFHRFFDLIPLPPSPGVRRGNNHNISVLAPLPWERGWGEVNSQYL